MFEDWSLTIFKCQDGEVSHPKKMLPLTLQEDLYEFDVTKQELADLIFNKKATTFKGVVLANLLDLHTKWSCIKVTEENWFTLYNVSKCNFRALCCDQLELDSLLFLDDKIVEDVFRNSGVRDFDVFIATKSKAYITHKPVRRKLVFRTPEESLAELHHIVKMTPFLKDDEVRFVMEEIVSKL